MRFHDSDDSVSFLIVISCSFSASMSRATEFSRSLSLLSRLAILPSNSDLALALALSPVERELPAGLREDTEPFGAR